MTRNEAPSEDYPLPPPFDLTKRTPKPPLMRLLSLFIFLYSKFLQVFTPSFNWWKPLCLSKWIHHNHGLFLPTFEPSGITHRHHLLSSAWVYRHLRFLRSGHSVPLYRTCTTPHSPYKFFYNVFKPSTPFKKTAPPLPDFQVVVVKYSSSDTELRI